MVSLKSRSNKSFKAEVVLDGETHVFDYPSLSLQEQLQMADNSEQSALFLLKKYAKVVDPELSDDDIMFLDHEVVEAVLKPVMDRYAQ